MPVSNSNILDCKKITEDWKSVLVLIFNNKGDLQS